jgi:hypothetical protein
MKSEPREGVEHGFEQGREDLWLWVAEFVSNAGLLFRYPQEKP